MLLKYGETIEFVFSQLRIIVPRNFAVFLEWSFLPKNGAVSLPVT